MTVFPGVGSTDQIGVPTGRDVPENTVTVMEALRPLKFAVSVAVPGARAVSCGGSLGVMLATDESLIVHFAPVTSCPISPTSLTARVCPESRLAIVGVMKIALGGTTGIGLKITDS